MTEDKFEYEVAFSFCQEDETLAYQINDLIQDRYRTFIYSNHQKEIAGTDGEETFNKVFGEDARTVVILYREKWGNTSWTRIEETAIKNRSLDEGCDFATFIKLDNKGKLPKWIPKTRLWFNMERWGIEGTASVIESRIQAQGGITKPETLEEKKEKLKRNIKLEQERKRYLASKQVQHDVYNIFNELYLLVEEKLSSLEDHETGIRFGYEKTANEKIIGRCENYNICFYWKQPYYDSIEESSLIVSLTKDDLNTPYFDKPNENTIKKKNYEFDANLNLDKGWREQKGNKKFLSNSQILDEWLKLFMDKVSEARIKRIREY